MLGAIGAIGPRPLPPPLPLLLSRLRALTSAEAVAATGVTGPRPAGGVTFDAYLPAVSPATSVATYNRLGRLDDSAASVVVRPLSGLDVAPLRHQRFEKIYTPAEVARAYGFDRTPLTGRGQTIAIPTAYHSPDLREDLRVFDRAFNLPSINLEVVNQRGGPPGGAVSEGWSVETALDVQWAHAVAPEAKILVVEADSARWGDMLQAVDYARRRSEVSVISMSWGSEEFPGELRFDSVLTTPRGHRGITFVAASGDDGAIPYWPSVSPNVLSVGGTSLSVTPTGRYAGEIAWSGSGGGVSAFERQPLYQRGVQATGWRTTPDVAYNAAPETGFAVYRGDWLSIGGTSAAAPQWAGLIALANEKRADRGLGPLEQAQRLVYSLPAEDFRDVTLGSNGYLAGPGYDLATGRGSPIADRVINDLARPLMPERTTAFGLRFVTVGGMLYPITLPGGNTI